MNAIYNLVVSCPDQVGIVAGLSNFIAQHGGLIIEADHHTNVETNSFFMRYKLDAKSLGLSISEFHQQFKPVADQFALQYRLRRENKKYNVLVLASLEPHCLEDLLYRWHNQELNANIVGVVSNHETLRKRTQWYEMPFYHVPIIGDDKAAHFKAIDTIIEDNAVDLIVLARYMQILPDELCQKYSGRIINIHHSFLPSFIGAKPYHQAYTRGVKLIGATSHYVTVDLDEGPIIEQDVVRVTHRLSLEQYIRLGRDIERLVLARALKAHLDDRVIIHGNKTIVFT